MNSVFYRRTLSLLLTAVLLLGLLPLSARAAESGVEAGFLQAVTTRSEVPAGWRGIRTAEDFQNIENIPGGKYMLLADLDLGDWTPLGSANTPFSGELDGNGHTVRYRIRTQSAKSQLLGLFAAVSGTVHDLRVAGSIEITDEGGPDRVADAGGLTAMLSAPGVLTNCVSDVSITAPDTLNVSTRHGFGGMAGVISGSAQDCALRYCRNRGSVTGSYVCGGIVGSFGPFTGKNIEIFACLNEGGIRAVDAAAGIVAYGSVAQGKTAFSFTISSCANTAPVTAIVFAGGILAGFSGSKSSRLHHEAVLSDCLNTGTITIDEGSVGGISGTGDYLTITRCVDTGAVNGLVDGAISGDGNSNIQLSQCYWLDSLSRQKGSNPPDRTGALSAEAMKREESYAGFDFETLWVIDEDLGCAYPLPLMMREYENTYKIAYWSETMKQYERSARFDSLITSVGGANGGVAGALSRSYRSAHLRFANNLWNGIEFLDDALSLSLDTHNNYDLVLAELLNQTFSEENYEELYIQSFCDLLSDVFTALEASMDARDAAKVQSLLPVLTSLGTESAAGTTALSQLCALLDKVDRSKLLRSGFELAGNIVNFTVPVGNLVEDLHREVSRYVLYNAADKTARQMAYVLQDTADALDNLESNSGKTQAQTALRRCARDLIAASNDNKIFLMQQLNDDLMLFTGEEGLQAVDLCYGKIVTNIPLVKAIREGVGAGVLLGNALTGMESIAAQGTMLEHSGYLAEGMYEVVRSRQAAYDSDASYERAAALKSATELYLSLQLLTCDYAIGYQNAIMTAALSQVFPGTTTDEAAACAELLVYKVKLENLRVKMQSYFSEETHLSGYGASCPVTVLVENADGTVVARQSTGEQSVAEGYAGYYNLLGENLDQKAGVYAPATQTLRILGEDSGTMDLIVYQEQEGTLTGWQFYGELPVTKNCEYTFTEDEAILDGTRRFSPSGSYARAFIDVAPGAWYAGDVDYVYENRIMSGVGERKFDPLGSANRAMVVTTLYRLAGSPAVDAQALPFADVPAGAWYTDAVAWAAANGIVSGMDEQHFAPLSPITREQFAAILYRYAGSPAADATALRGYPDAETVSPWATDALGWAVAHEIINGTASGGQTLLAPQGGATRCQIAAILHRFCT